MFHFPFCAVSQFYTSSAIEADQRYHTSTDIQKKLSTAFLLPLSQAKSAFAPKDLDTGLLGNQKHIMYLVNVCRSGLQIKIGSRRREARGIS